MCERWPSLPWQPPAGAREVMLKHCVLRGSAATMQKAALLSRRPRCGSSALYDMSFQLYSSDTCACHLPGQKYPLGQGFFSAAVGQKNPGGHPFKGFVALIGQLLPSSGCADLTRVSRISCELPGALAKGFHTSIPCAGTAHGMWPSVTRAAQQHDAGVSHEALPEHTWQDSTAPER
jgi:hypothetical protein